MHRESAARMPCLILIPATLLALLILPPVAQAEKPMLAIRLNGGESAIYPVSEIDQAVFGGDMVLVLRAEGVDSSALA